MSEDAPPPPPNPRAKEDASPPQPTRRRATTAEQREPRSRASLCLASDGDAAVAAHDGGGTLAAIWAALALARRNETTRDRDDHRRGRPFRRRLELSSLSRAPRPGAASAGAPPMRASAPSHLAAAQHVRRFLVAVFVAATVVRARVLVDVRDRDQVAAIALKVLRLPPSNIISTNAYDAERIRCDINEYI